MRTQTGRSSRRRVRGCCFGARSTAGACPATAVSVGGSLQALPGCRPSGILPPPFASAPVMARYPEKPSGDLPAPACLAACRPFRSCGTATRQPHPLAKARQRSRLGPPPVRWRRRRRRLPPPAVMRTSWRCCIGWWSCSSRRWGAYWFGRERWVTTARDGVSMQRRGAVRNVMFPGRWELSAMGVRELQMAVNAAAHASWELGCWRV